MSGDAEHHKRASLQMPQQQRRNQTKKRFGYRIQLWYNRMLKQNGVRAASPVSEKRTEIQCNERPECCLEDAETHSCDKKAFEVICYRLYMFNGSYRQLSQPR